MSRRSPALLPYPTVGSVWTCTKMRRHVHDDIAGVPTCRLAITNAPERGPVLGTLQSGKRVAAPLFHFTHADGRRRRWRLV